METRTRSRRYASDVPPATMPEVRRTTRATRQTTVPASVVSAPQKSQQSRTSVPTPGSRPRIEIPHRAPRLSRREGSIASMATSRPNRDDDTDFGDDTQLYSDQLQVTRVLERGMDHTEEGDDSDDEEETVNHKVRNLSLVDLERASADVMDLLMEPGFESRVFKAVLQVKNGTLEGIRKLYLAPGEEAFIHWRELINLYEDPDEAATAAAIMVRANITTAFGHLRRAQFRKTGELYTLLEKLNVLFPELFKISDTIEPKVNLVLDIRTWFFIELMAAQEGPVDPHELVAHVFCEHDAADYAHLFSHGPFRKIWDEQDGEYDLDCADRIAKIMAAIKKDKKTHGVEELRKLFPLEELLENLEEWFTEIYQSLDEESSSQDGLLPDAPSATGEEHNGGIGGSDVEIEDSQTDIGESQPIVRAGTADEEPTLYQNPTSLRYLDGRATGNTPVPPSNQQQAVPPPGAPKDYRDHRNSELLLTPPPQGNGEGPSRKRNHQEIGADDDFPESHGGGVEEEDDEDDGFETDSRPVDKGKRAAIATSMPPPKRPRTANPMPPPSSLPIPATSSQHPPHTTSSLEPDFSALKATKDLIARQHRLTTTQPFKQRHPWSDHDCALLIELIRDRHAAWASIEKNDRDRFQIPRGQQAYRDKARNLKVDYLMTDVVLPPCFDLVALGKKEIDRLVGLGKNPYRREADVDENGFAIGTEYRRRRPRGEEGDEEVDEEVDEVASTAT